MRKSFGVSMAELLQGDFVCFFFPGYIKTDSFCEGNQQACIYTDNNEASNFENTSIKKVNTQAYYAQAISTFLNERQIYFSSAAASRALLHQSGK